MGWNEAWSIPKTQRFRLIAWKEDLEKKRNAKLNT